MPLWLQIAGIAVVACAVVYVQLRLMTDIISLLTWANFKRVVVREWAELCRLNRLNFRALTREIKRLLPVRYVVYDDVEAEWGLTKRQARAILRMNEKSRARSVQN